MTSTTRLSMATLADQAAFTKDKKRRWELTSNHWDLPIHIVAVNAADEQTKEEAILDKQHSDSDRRLLRRIEQRLYVEKSRNGAKASFGYTPLRQETELEKHRPSGPPSLYQG